MNEMPDYAYKSVFKMKKRVKELHSLLLINIEKMKDYNNIFSSRTSSSSFTCCLCASVSNL